MRKFGFVFIFAVFFIVPLHDSSEVINSIVFRFAGFDNFVTQSRKLIPDEACVEFAGDSAQVWWAKSLSFSDQLKSQVQCSHHYRLLFKAGNNSDSPSNIFGKEIFRSEIGTIVNTD